jgi:hypothetical protein
MKQKYELNLGYIIYRKLDFLDLTYVRQIVTAFRKPRNSAMHAVTFAAGSADSSVLRNLEKVFFLRVLTCAHLAVYSSESAKDYGIIFL